jgi:hypothetical protein
MCKECEKEKHSDIEQQQIEAQEQEYWEMMDSLNEVET